MNIYLHVEVSGRELDSKLLLAVLAASKGHEVIVSSLGPIIKGLNFKILSPGIFHTKSLTPGKDKIDRHQKIVDKGFKITSIDEESGVDSYGYDKFAKSRYSDFTIQQSSAVFGWGSEDTNTLKKFYVKNSHKIHKTGSPRADLWKPFFFDYWEAPRRMPKKSFLLVSTNQICTNMQSFHEWVKSLKDGGYFERDKDYFKNVFYGMAEDYKKLYEFIEAIKYLAKHNNGYDVVLRPHPRDNVKAWEIFFEGFLNVHIVREDSITTWVKNSFAVMHNGCTTAIEATISNKPILTYIPFEMNYKFIKGDLANQLGHIVKSKEKLLIKTNEIFNDLKIKKQNKAELKISDALSQKIYIDNNELASEKIVKIWESLDDKNLSCSNNWTKFYWLLKVMKYTRVPRRILGKMFPKKFKTFKENHKFPPINKNYISERISRLQKLLSIEEKIECKILSDRTILIKKI